MDPNEAYSNAAYIPGGDAYPARWASEAAAVRAASPPQRIRYGDTPRQFVDLFRPEGAAKGLLCIVHGGYWMAFGPEDFSQLAAGALRRGWAAALIGYDLCPDVRIAQITAQVAEGVAEASEQVDGPVHLTGHSAGGHLVARMGCADYALGVDRIVPISPLADLAPLRATKMNDVLGIDALEALEESPASWDAPECEVEVWVGADERPAFLDQARLLGAAWGCPVTEEPGRHHFDVIEGLGDPDSALMAAVLGERA